MSFTFIVLHYNEGALLDTFECVDSILNLKNEHNLNIVVVENGSHDSSILKLKDRFDGNPLVEVIGNSENLGFAQGNNIGYNYAIQSYNPDFILCVNNDIVISQNNFLDKIIEEYNYSNFHILGPKILSKNLVNQNPNGFKVKTLREVNHLIDQKQFFLAELKKEISFYFIFIKFKEVIKSIPIIGILLLKLKYFLKQEPLIIVNDKVRQENVQLHGSALVFSKLYIKSYAYAFYPKTYLYREEDILFYIANRDNLKTVYSPNVEIYHKEDVSTNASIKGKEKRIFTLKHSLESCIVLKKLMEEDLKKRRNSQ